MTQGPSRAGWVVLLIALCSVLLLAGGPSTALGATPQAPVPQAHPSDTPPTPPRSPATYTLTFVESGLALGTNWTVDLSSNSSYMSLHSTTRTLVDSYAYNGSYFYTVPAVGSYSVTPGWGSLTVNGANLTILLNFTSFYNLTFVESGLAVGTLWWVILANGSMSSTSTNLTLREPNGTYSYSVHVATGYNATVTSGSVVINGANVSIQLRFTLQAGYFAVTFHETGLIVGWGWAVVLGGSGINSTSSSISFPELNGTYAYQVWPPYTWNSTPTSGSATVSGNNQTISVVLIPPPIDYLVSFQESGLAAGTHWAVELGGRNQSSLPFNGSSTWIDFSEVNGAYSYKVWPVDGYVATPSSGVVTVNGSDQSVRIAFKAVPFGVSFTESGLPSGTVWSVTLGGATHATNASAIFVHEPNGTYSYSVAGVRGYSQSPTSGTVTVSGANRTVSVAFTLVTFRVTFSETGLASGTNWSVDLGGVVRSSASSSVLFQEQNGTYSYLVGSVSGYSVNGSSTGNLTVNGAAAGVSVAFASTSASLVRLSFEASGLPAGTNWSVTLAPSTSGLTIESTTTLTHWSDGGTTVVFFASEGTYTYTTSASGYGAAGGTVRVTAAAHQMIGVAFRPLHTQPPPGAAVLDLPAWTPAVGLAFLVIGAIGLGITASRHRVREKERGRAVVADISQAQWESDANGEPVARANR